MTKVNGQAELEPCCELGIDVSQNYFTMGRGDFPEEIGMASETI